MTFRDPHELVELYTSAMNEVTRKLNLLMTKQVHQELTTDQFTTLRYLEKNKTCTSSELADQFSIGKSAVTAQINRLVSKGLISRQRDEYDRRVVFLSLSPKGEVLVKQGTERLYDVLGDILLEFNQDEIESFIQTLEKLVHILRQKS